MAEISQQPFVQIYDEDGNSVESAPHPQQKLAVDLGTEIEKYDSSSEGRGIKIQTNL